MFYLFEFSRKSGISRCPGILQSVGERYSQRLYCPGGEVLGVLRLTERIVVQSFITCQNRSQELTRFFTRMALFSPIIAVTKPSSTALFVW